MTKEQARILKRILLELVGDINRNSERQIKIAWYKAQFDRLVSTCDNEERTARNTFTKAKRVALEVSKKN